MEAEKLKDPDRECYACGHPVSEHDLGWCFHKEGEEYSCEQDYPCEINEPEKDFAEGVDSFSCSGYSYFPSEMKNLDGAEDNCPQEERDEPASSNKKEQEQ